MDSVGLRVEMPTLATADRAFLISLAMLLDNFDETTGMVQDKSYDLRGSRENTTATAKLAKLLAMAMELDMVDTNAARSAIIKIANVFTNMPRGPTNRIAGTNQLLPHFTMNGGTAPHPDSEWASGDTAFALEDLAVALQMIGDPHGQLPGVTNMFGQIDWSALRGLPRLFLPRIRREWRYDSLTSGRDLASRPSGSFSPPLPGPERIS